MKYGISITNFGSYADVRTLASLAHDAEAAGWDGFFVWDHISSAATDGRPACDPWVALTAIALATERLRIGTMVTPVARRRPWKLARETVTLDRLSAGRLVLGVGLGYPPEEYTSFGEDADDRVRAAKLDEGLEVLTGLWSGTPFSYDGQHYHLEHPAMLPPPVQSPRIPIWVAGMSPARPPFRRAARWDGVVPLHADLTPFTVDEVAAVAAYVRAHRPDNTPFELVLSGESSGHTSPLIWRTPPREYEAAAATWWLESITDWRGTVDEMRAVVRAGPQR